MSRAMDALFAVLLTLSLLTSSSAVDRNNFKRCSDSGFCTRCRDHTGYNVLSVQRDSVVVDHNHLEAVVTKGVKEVKLRLQIIALKDDSIRLRITEAFPIVPRFEPPLVLSPEDPERGRLSLMSEEESKIELKVGASGRLVLHMDPLLIEVYRDDVLVVSFNKDNLFRFEHTRLRDDNDNLNLEEEEEDEESGPGMWEETFKNHKDTKPRGPNAIAADITIHNSKDVYGLPEHADKLNLRDTTGEEPFRLYNLDVFEFEVWNTMALYASVPFVQSLDNVGKSVGVFWFNAAETWVDVKRQGQGVLGTLSSMISDDQTSSVRTHFMSETGNMDVFILLGPSTSDVSRQLGSLLGNRPVPPEFSLGYQQCRWNYNDQQDVLNVNSNLDKYDIPADAIWLDIEHTDGKRYFTWDDRKFPDPLSMVHNLTSVGRKLITIVDPHIKMDDGYKVYKELKDQNMFVKETDGQKDYEGYCWPGPAMYPDFLDPAVRSYFAEQYKLENYKGTTLDVYTWNDMNEPSVFNGPEVTMQKDKLHTNGVEHRELHNIYGHLYLASTFEGHLLRSDNQLRPFVLTRAAFAGSQRYSAIWTGDNTASWVHLESATPMCLSLSVAGLTQVGADVGGFFGNPDGELLVRWYQAGAFQTFFRGHSHIDTKRREPWLFSEAERKLMRKAIVLRYSYLPLWYTLFYENEQVGKPPMRPVWYEFPEDAQARDVDYEHLVGDALLVRPVTQSGATSVNVYFPGQDQIWYDIYTKYTIDQQGLISVPVGMESIPIYQRGGTVIPKKERVRRSATLMRGDPITLHVALDKKGGARGKLYLDDGKSFAYRDGHYLLVQYDFKDSKLNSNVLNNDNKSFKTSSWVEKIVVMGIAQRPSKGISLITPTSEPQSLGFTFYPEKKVLEIRKPAVNVGDEWQISIE